MTLCIAAKCATCMGANHPAVVLCADKRFETLSAGADVGFKFEDLGQGWVAMLAGDVAIAMELCTQYRFHLRDIEVTDQNLLETFTGPAEKEFEKSEGVVCDLLVCGFTEGHAHILHVDSQAEVRVSREPHFGTIGNGKWNADAMLHYRGQHSAMPFNRTLYHVYEAKVFAQSAPGVGEKTDVGFISSHGVCRFLSNSGLDYLEAFREFYGPKPTAQIPDEQLHCSFIATWSERRDMKEPEGGR